MVRAFDGAWIGLYTRRLKGKGIDVMSETLQPLSGGYVGDRFGGAPPPAWITRYVTRSGRAIIEDIFDLGGSREK
jgi:hypothetical protein